MKRLLFMRLIMVVSTLFSWNISALAQEFGEEKANFWERFDNTFQTIKQNEIQLDNQATVSRSTKKVSVALYGFLETDFMKQYKEIKLNAESLVATFKAYSSEFPPNDVGRVRKSYAIIADKFNSQLMEIKAGFLDKDVIKVIRTTPDIYSSSLQFKLRELQDEYSQTFARTVAEITGSEEYSAFPIAGLMALIDLTMKFTNYLASTSAEARRMNEDYLNMYLIEPYRFRPWDEIQMVEGGLISNQEEYYNNEDFQEEEYVEPQEEENINTIDPFVETENTEVTEGAGKTKPKEKPKTAPVKKKNN